MIVKNENSIIEKNLRSAKGIVDYWVVVDTGSSDGTQETVRRVMGDIPGELHERPWVDFAHNRNEALELARGKGDYILFMDADEEFVFGSGFKMPKLTQDGYHLRFRKPEGAIDFQRLWMIRDDPNWKWVGVLHETVENPKPHSVGLMEDFYVLLSGDVGSRSADPEKYAKDARILEAAVEKEPTNSRYVFYLAQSYLNVQNYAKALTYYEKRAGMGGFEEEVFISLYAVAQMKNILEPNSEAFVNDLTKAFLFRSVRAEPLHMLANHYIRSKNYFMGYLVSKFGAALPMSQDALWVEKWIYDWGLLHQQAFCAAQLGRRNEALQLFSRLLKKETIPAHIRVELEKNFKTL
ncbi:MAG TPA: glycosyltransferase [Chlamydiales bacterium]|nr:glycosyltransferase [Chlamydiales bacterium]